MESVRAIFQPRSVAVVGASDSPSKLGHTILKNIVEGGFQGAIYPINPKASKILDLVCFKNVLDVKDQIDLAVVVVPAKFVPQVVKDCGDKGVGGAVIITGGFAEAGEEGEELQRQVVELGKQYRVRLLGPNCQGVNMPYHSLCASWPLLTHRGRIAVVSQSGTVGAAMMDWLSDEGLGVSGFVSLGNRCDVNEVDLVRYFDEDERTAVIALYIEGFKKPHDFGDVCKSLRKPLVLLKSGRTPKGIKAAESHTRSLAGDDAIYNAFCNKYNICRAETIEEFLDFAKAFAYLPRPKGNKIFFVTTSGGAGILATDQAEREGLDVAPLSEDLQMKLKPLIPPHAICSNPLDLTGDATASMFGDVLAVARDFYDIAGIIFGDPITNASDVVMSGAKDLVIYLGGADVEKLEKRKMHEKGIPVFPTPERAVRAVAQLLRPDQKKRKEKLAVVPKVEIGEPNTQLMSPSGALTFLSNEGFPCLHFQHAESVGKAVHVAHLMGFPIAMKLDSSLIAHKTDIGGVYLALQTASQVRKSFEKIKESFAQAFPNIPFPGVIIMPMAEPGTEFIMGAHRNAEFGTVLLFGLGGVYVELFQDVTVKLLPLSHDDIREMVKALNAHVLFEGYRNREALDEKAVVDGLSMLASLMEKHREIVTVDINPAIVYSEGYAIVDARIVYRKQEI